MNDFRYGQLKMLRTSTDFLSENSEITLGMPRFAVYFSVVTGNLVKITDLTSELDVCSTSQSAHKKQLRKQLINKTFDVSCVLAAFANNTENYVLLKEVKLSKSDFRIGEEKLIARCLKIHDLGVLHLTDMTGYETSQKQLDDQQTLITQFTGQLSSVRLAIGSRSNIGVNILLLLADAIGALKSIDFLVRTLRTKHPDFYNQYQIARRIVTIGQNSKAALGVVKVDTTDELLKRVSVKAYVYNGAEKQMAMIRQKPVLQSTTGAKGRFSYRKLEAGMYRIVASKPGFANFEEIISIADGETTRIEIMMEKAI